VSAKDAESDWTGGRRELLAAGAAAVAGLAGCLGNPFDPGAEQEAGGGTADETGAGDEQSRSGDGTADGSADGDDTGTTGSGATDGDGSADGGGTDGNEEPSGPPEPDLVVDVAQEAFQFTPERFEITAGQTVKWVWQDGGHNIRVESTPDGSDWTGTAGGATDTYPEGHELVSTFETVGEYEYYCAPHRSLGLEGSFAVVEE